jgi:hypothetical protein
MDEEVYGFTEENTRGMTEWERAPLPYADNGMSNMYAQTAHKHQHHKKAKDIEKYIAERAMDEEVNGFAEEQVRGISRERKDDFAYDYNGVNNMYAQSHHKHKHHKHAKDIAERAMDEEVHGFASDNVRGIAWGRQEDFPYGNNGNLNMYSQHKHKKHSKFPHNPFIAERGMDEEVHGFVEDAINNPLGPIRNDEAYPLNGYKNVYADVDHSTSWTPSDFTTSEAASGPPEWLGQVKRSKHHKDIAERKMDAEVHGFATHALPPLNGQVKRETPYAKNG